MSRATIERVERLASNRRFAEAEALCRSLLRTSPHHVQASKLLGRILRESGRPEASLEVLKPLATQRPHDPTVARELGGSLLLLGQTGPAKPWLRRAKAALPHCPETMRWLGLAALREFNPGAALPEFEAAIRVEPANPQNHRLLAAACIDMGRPAQAEEVLRGLLATDGDSPETWTVLAQALEHQSKNTEAVEAYRRAIELSTGPTDIPSGGLVRCLHAEGRLDEAAAFAAAEHQRAPSARTAVSLGTTLLATGDPAQAAAVLEAALASAEADEVRREVFFLLGQARQGLGEYDGAFAAFKAGNELLGVRFSAERLDADYDALRALHDALPPSDDPRFGSGCVFVVGMPRSGTTLLEQILDSHPLAHGGGELQLLRRLLWNLVERLGGDHLGALADATPDQLHGVGRAFVDHLRSLAPGATVVVEKTPHNFELLGVIDRILPGARVIHSRRSPIDTCLSCYTMLLSPWHTYATDLRALGAAYARYERLMRHWERRLTIPILLVAYESLVADLENEVRRILDFAGLPWDDACAEFWKNTRAVSTPSVDQVRRPIYRSSMSRWKRYEGHLGPLLDSLRAEGVQLQDDAAPDQPPAPDR